MEGRGNAEIEKQKIAVHNKKKHDEMKKVLIL